jgi:hypothetical protein
MAGPCPQLSLLHHQFFAAGFFQMSKMQAFRHQTAMEPPPKPTKLGRQAILP